MSHKSLFSHLECHECGAQYSKLKIQTYCHHDNQPLLAKYHLENSNKEKLIESSDASMWRYKSLLPVENVANIVSNGEGWTPLLPMNKIAKDYGQNSIFLKEEGLNPTGSFKARGLAMAVSKAKEYGIKTMCIPTAGNAGSALAAYCAKAAMESKIFMPKATPDVFRFDAEIMGSDVQKIDGTICDAGKAMRDPNNKGEWFDVTTLKEPYRLEGKKTMGYEIAEQLDWKLPDVIIYPTGGGTGLIGIWKAFKEMQSLGWINDIKTRMVAVQIDACNPIVKAFNNKSDTSEPFNNPGETIANGLRVPHAFGHKLILKTLYSSKGTAVSISEIEMLQGANEFAKSEGVFLCPEGAAVWKGYQKLRRSNWIKATDQVILLNTGSPYKYIDNFLNFDT